MSTPPPLPRPLRVLALLAPQAAAAAGASLERALAPLRVSADVLVERLPVASEAALRQALAQPWHVLVMGGFRGRAQPAARLAMLQLQGSDGGLRDVSVPHLGALLAGAASLRLVLLVGSDASLAALAAALLVKAGVPAAAALLSEGDEAIPALASELVAALAAGQPPAALAGRAGLRLAARLPDAPLWAPAAPRVAADASLTASPTAASASPSAETLARETLARKRGAGAFDVFLCHHGADKPAVKRIAERLMARGLLPWLDEWELPPGQPWQPLLERQIAAIRSAAVFVGAAGIGPWQQAELYGFLSEFRERGCPVIPVLLPDAPARPDLPIFLKAMTWVDFRLRDPDPLARLVWGVSGERTHPS
jgi:hypothetical protein